MRKIKPNRLLSTVAAMLLLFTGSAQAALFLSFTTPDGIVGANDEVPVWVTLTTDTGFLFDAEDPDGDQTFGGAIDSADLPESEYFDDANMGAGGEVIFDEIIGVNLNMSFSCSGSFTDGMGTPCSPGDNYSFGFNTSGADGPTLIFEEFLSMDAGDSLDFLFGTFTPVAGGAAPGTYDFFGVNLFVDVALLGYDDFGEAFFSSFQGIDLARTCNTGDSSCDFTRTVVPVPAAVWFLASGVLCLFGLRRTQK